MTRVIDETAATVEFDGGVAVGDLEVKEFGVVLAGGVLCEVKKLRANSLSAMGGLYEEFVNPCAFAAIFEATWRVTRAALILSARFITSFGLGIPIKCDSPHQP